MAQANGAKSAAIAASQGEAQRFLSVYAAYSQAKDVTLKRLYIETMQDIFKNTHPPPWWMRNCAAWYHCCSSTAPL